MNFLGLEEIQAYKNVFEYKLYRYNDEINTARDFICNLRLIRLELEDVYIGKDIASSKGICMVYNVCGDFSKEEFKNSIKDFLLDEIVNLDIEKENIEVIIF